MRGGITLPARGAWAGVGGRRRRSPTRELARDRLTTGVGESRNLARDRFGEAEDAAGREGLRRPDRRRVLGKVKRSKKSWDGDAADCSPRCRSALFAGRRCDPGDDPLAIFGLDPRSAATERCWEECPFPVMMLHPRVDGTHGTRGGRGSDRRPGARGAVIATNGAHSRWRDLLRSCTVHRHGAFIFEEVTVARIAGSLDRAT